jgi:acetyl-CoA carboxylase carboxyl transferase subunit alpha
LRKSLLDALTEAQSKSTDELIESRFERLMAYGKFKETPLR